MTSIRETLCEQRAKSYTADFADENGLIDASTVSSGTPNLPPAARFAGSFTVP
jgi:hypothetical protein